LVSTVVPLLEEQVNLSALTMEEQTAKAVALVDVNLTPKVEECSLTTDYKSDEEEETNPNELKDPLKEANWIVDYINRNVLYRGLFRPLTLGFKLLPEDIRIGLSNVFYTAREPVHIINNLLQLKFERFGLGLLRLGINLTVGVGGIFDPSCKWLNICKMEADFGQTLGYYGIDPGPYVVLPIFGPSSVRDIFGLIGDLAASPPAWFGYVYLDLPQSSGAMALERVNNLTFNYRDIDILNDTLEPYYSLKHIFENCRAERVRQALER
jgi:phospholipid-binding lipoprotein MlaA